MLEQINMTIKCNVELSDSGKIMRIFHENNRLIAEMLVHGPLLQVVQNCDGELPILKGRPNVFRAEVYGLSGYEYLDTNEERIFEK